MLLPSRHATLHCLTVLMIFTLTACRSGGDESTDTDNNHQNTPVDPDTDADGDGWRTSRQGRWNRVADHRGTGGSG